MYTPLRKIFYDGADLGRNIYINYNLILMSKKYLI